MKGHWALVALGLLLAGCGAVRTVTRTSPPALPAAVRADPTLDANCVAEPNRPPSCTQGDYRVSITIGASCYDPGYAQPETWQWTYDGSATVRCMTDTAAEPASTEFTQPPAGRVVCSLGECVENGRDYERPTTGQPCDHDAVWHERDYSDRTVYNCT